MRKAKRQRLAYVQALKAYEILAKRVLGALTPSKETAAGSWALSRDERETLREMIRLLDVVLDFDRKYFNDEEPPADGGSGGGRLDLDDARAEIARRLDRLAAAGGA